MLGSIFPFFAYTLLMPERIILGRIRALVGPICGLAAMATNAASTSVVISQIYGGGGNFGSVYQNDFIELHNKGSTPVSLSGWTVQYADTNNWQLTALGGTLQPGQYYLVQQAGGPNGSPLPSPNSSSSVNLGASGKVALVNNLTLLSGTCPTSASIIDFVGYGSANCFEGSAAGALANTTAAVRKSNGCTETDNNLADFSITTPNARNTGSSFVSCALPAPVFTAWGRTTNGFFQFQFTADPARSNLVQFSTNLTSWSILTAAVSQAGNLFTCTDTNPAVRRSYRIWSQ
jgi:hypothetical protein